MHFFNTTTKSQNKRTKTCQVRTFPQVRHIFFPTGLQATVPHFSKRAVQPAEVLVRNLYKRPFLDEHIGGPRHGVRGGSDRSLSVQTNLGVPASHLPSLWPAGAQGPAPLTALTKGSALRQGQLELQSKQTSETCQPSLRPSGTIQADKGRCPQSAPLRKITPRRPDQSVPLSSSRQFQVDRFVVGHLAF